MLDIPTNHFTYQFPLDSILLKSRETGGYVNASIIQLTRWRAYWGIQRRWEKYRGPFAETFREREDLKWRWVTFVRKCRKNPAAQCAAAQTSDEMIQGAIIYRADGRSILEPDQGAVFVEYIATAPHNRDKYAKNPLYRGVGEGLILLAALQSYNWGSGGRIVLGSLPGAVNFYKKQGFVETNQREDRIVYYELPSEVAIGRLEGLGLI
jgi:hypothetical protein